MSNTIDNVLILQGGVSLGAFGCGVFKALINSNIKLDIVAGTSIGGINAAIIAGAKNEKHPKEELEQFWLELSEGFVDLNKHHTFPSLPRYIEEMLLPSNSGYDKLATNSTRQKDFSSFTMNASERAIKMKQLRIFLQLPQPLETKNVQA